MTKYTCELCKKEFSQKSHYTTHQNRKTPCTGRKCNKSFQTQYAYINKKIISIDKFIKRFQNKKGKLKCSNGHELCFVPEHKRLGKKVKSFFKHKNPGDTGGGPMSLWHSEWQGNFPITEKYYQKLETQISARSADAVLENYNKVIEFQHSRIKHVEVENRISDYKLHKMEVIWIIDGNNTILEKKLNAMDDDRERIILEFMEQYWKFESFKCCEHVYIDINQQIYKVSPQKIKSNMTDVLVSYPKTDFITAIKQNKDLWKALSPPRQCTLHVTQAVAGSGKTWLSIQNLKGHKFQHYKNFIFLTKQHSAKKVIYREFKKQLDEGSLSELSEMDHYESGEKCIIRYKNMIGNPCQVIIATVDAFGNAIANKSTHLKQVNKFESKINSIIDQHINTDKSGRMEKHIAWTKTGKKVKLQLNKETLIIIDEAQDLPEYYARALIQIMKSHFIDIYIIGDKFQSISFEKNTLSLLSETKFPNIHTYMHPPISIVRRWTSAFLTDFNNKIHNFHKHGLSKFQQPQDYKDVEPSVFLIEDTSCPWWKTDKSNVPINDQVEKIMKSFEKEVDELRRIPEDFLIVTPFTSKNPLCDALELRINNFWKKKITVNAEYRKEVLYKHKEHGKWWEENCVDDWKDKYYEYAKFHKSETGSSINTDESDHSTRIVSIHTSKGDGRPVVFIINLSESALRRFSGKTENLRYDSLFHVATTRSKEKLYIYLKINGDNICQRIVKFFEDSQTELDFKPIMDINKKIKYNNLIESPFIEKKYGEIMKQIPPIHENWPFEPKKKVCIDQSHHNIRYSTMAIKFSLEAVCQGEKSEGVKKQIVVILLNVVKANIVETDSWKEQNFWLRRNLEISRERTGKPPRFIPIFKISQRGRDYKEYFKIIKKTMTKLKEKIQQFLRVRLDPPNLCPFESVLLYYMMGVVEHGYFSNINITDVYRMTDIYNISFEDTHPGHEKCLCKELFNDDSKDETSNRITIFKKYLIDHYENMGKLEKQIEIINKDYPNISWLMNYPLSFLGANKDFELNNKFIFIGYNKDTVVIIYLKPQFSEINLGKVELKSIFDTYLIKDIGVDTIQGEKFYGKKIITAILTTNQNKPYYMHWGDINGDSENIIKQLFHNFLIEKYTEEGKSMYNFYKYWRKNDEEYSKPLEFITSLKEKFSDARAFPNIEYPDFLWSFLHKMQFQLEEVRGKKRQKKILKQYDKENYFMKLMIERLKASINRFMSISDEDSEYDSEDDSDHSSDE